MLKRNAKKRTCPIPSHLERTSLVNKGLVIYLFVFFIFPCDTKAKNRERALLE